MNQESDSIVEEKSIDNENKYDNIIKTPPTSSNWLADGLDICTTSYDNEYPEIISDGIGGAIIVWEDYRLGPDGDIYAQRINSSGERYWINNGIPIKSDFLIGQYDPKLISDGAGGAIITWWGWGGSDWDIYAQRINASGDLQWTADGVLISSATGDQFYPQICPDGYGGAIIAWNDLRGSDRDIYAQRINASGDLYWDNNGTKICTYVEDQDYFDLCSDGDGGAIIAWEDERGSYEDIYAQRINKTGDCIWDDNGTAICNTDYGQYNPKIISDAIGGAIIAWEDTRIFLNRDIYAQRINKTGDIYWDKNGTVICNAPDKQEYIDIITDGANGAILAWEDSRDEASSNIDLYIQRINSSGDGQWDANGIAISTKFEDVDKVRIVSDGNGGGIIGWIDNDFNLPRVQIINSTGDAQLKVNGVSLITRNILNGIFSFEMCEGNPSIPGTAFVVWHDERDGLTNTNIRAQYAKIPKAPVLNAISPSIDYDGDINLNWSKEDCAIEYYVYRNTSFISTLGGLTPVATITQNEYTDTLTSAGTFYYVVVAKGALGESAISNCKSVQAILPPGDINLTSTANVPEDLDGSFQLNWNISKYADNYSLYRDTSFINDPTTAILIVAGNTNRTYNITSLTNGTYYYIVVAFNEYGNMSSNCLEINVTLYPPGFFMLYSTAGSPDNDGNFNLNWDVSKYTNNYSLYWDTSFINDPTIANLIVEGNTNRTYNIIGLTNGRYYYIVVAFNKCGNKTSNCLDVLVQIDSGNIGDDDDDDDDDDGDGEPIILSYDILILVSIFAIVSVILIKKCSKIN